MDEESQKTLDKLLSTAIVRRLEPLDQIGSHFSSVNLLKLDNDRFVFTFMAHNSGRVILHVLAEQCQLIHGLWYSDATVLIPGESPEEFFKNNLYFIVPAQDNARYVECMSPGMSMDLVKQSSQAFLFESVGRVLAHMNRWISFLGLYQNDLPLASELLNLALAEQNSVLKEMLNSTDSKDIALKVEFFDRSQPLALLETGKAVPGLDKAVLRRYLETAVIVRKKLVTSYPKHQSLIQRDKALLRDLKGS